ncbi:lipopolysaccharide biosynthesis protein [Tellurirhabdus bombi]|uniref:lipopolysaccharide biosynthesis protein n=1 Tax=Tellurirhabdus bombi TaxID=2907205 RepID=UPI001F1B67A5|nr:MATE family efflux transporter [Tellurirhabdus bombi]
MLTLLRHYYKTGNALTITVRRNVIQSLGIKAASVIINLALVPLTLGLLTKELYGVWLTLSSIVAWFTFIDFGLGNGLRNKVTELLAQGKQEQAQTYVSTLYVATLLIGVGFWAVYTLIHPWLDWASIMNVSARWQAEISQLAYLAFCAFSLELVLRNINFVLLATHKSAVNGLFPFLSNVITLLLLLSLKTVLKVSILYVGLAVLLPQLFVLVGFHIYFFGFELAYLKPRWRMARRSVLSQFGSLGLQFFVIQLAWTIIFTTTNLLITRFLGPGYVAEYTIAYRYFGLLPMVFNIVLAPLWSAFGHAYHTQDLEWIKKTLTRMRQLWLGVVVGQLVLLATAPYLIPAWVDESVTVSFSLAVAMLIYQSLYIYGDIYVSLLNGVSQIRNQLIATSIAAALLIPLTYALVKLAGLGLVGILIAMTLCLLYSVGVAPLEVKRLLAKMTGRSTIIHKPPAVTL